MITHIRVQTEDFDVNHELAALASEGAEVGALASFIGIVRSDDGLTSMTLEHYPGMTEREIASHVKDAEARWPLEGVTIIHRTGTLKPGDRIVLVAVASRHRAAAFEACAFLMDYLKTRAPFWKREERGTALSWVEAKPSDDDAAGRWRTK
jgi:molybdopterin synthase catalytic subunit